MIPDAYKISFYEEPCVWSVKFLHNIYLCLKHVFFVKIYFAFILEWTMIHNLRYENGGGNGIFVERMFVTLTYHQFFADLALIYLNPNEVMRVTAIFAEKNLKFFVTLT